MGLWEASKQKYTQVDSSEFRVLYSSMINVVTNIKELLEAQYFIDILCVCIIFLMSDIFKEVQLRL